MGLQIEVAEIDINTIEQGFLLRYKRACDRLADLESAYQHHLEILTEEYPDFASVARRLDSTKKSVAELKSQLEAHARETARSFRGEGVSVSYSNPTSVTYEADELIERHPKALEIPNLITQAVNKEALECAVAAGWIPEKVVEDIKHEEPKYKRGRVQIKLLKGDS